jgi:hypothetical protein
VHLDLEISTNYCWLFLEVLKIKGKDKVYNDMVGVNRRNNGERAINGCLSRNCMEKMGTFPEIGYRYVHKYYT